MSIKSIPNGYEVDCRPQGRIGKRYRKKFKTRGEAIQYERWLISAKGAMDWVEKPKDKRKLSELVDLWFKHKGRQLKSGLGSHMKLNKLARALGDPKACDVTRRMFADYRTERLASGAKETTINRTQMLLSGVFTTLIDIEEYHSEHPLKGMTKLKAPVCEMGFLSRDEIKLLLETLQGDNLKVAKLCLSTGARWGEVVKLRGSHVIGGKVIFVDTKNGKNRTVPIKPNLLAEIYNGKSGVLLKPCYQEFRETLKKLEFDLPKGQSSHVLRHTFASHFMMNGGNILTLQKILGHATIMQTMTYAHLAPDYLNEAMEFNPLSTF